MKNDNDILNELLNARDPEETYVTRVKMALAALINNRRISKELNKQDLGRIIGKHNPSEVSKWLSGTHNFTINTLARLDFKLNMGVFKPILENNYMENIYSLSGDLVSEPEGDYFKPKKYGRGFEEYSKGTLLEKTTVNLN